MEGNGIENVIRCHAVSLWTNIDFQSLTQGTCVFEVHIIRTLALHHRTSIVRLPHVQRE